ncbi:hypothetical protein FisN_11Hh345 [Fistulifera solaris]|jgi:hypothetical protein|uniref:Uncharacterized protein n=1 Tax=Fistulifera solaris TaxID=1519565 RepID=A0A1Z5K950_FISSO|nr:hypothetical protein FisN_11Hh345 [Fistulifera solaris]|eukprot:GAX22764.1 hypothetical protein FisN_11Hh345 [Fistulifera solaris]
MNALRLRQVPPAFYGIYQDGDNDQNFELSSDDVDALRRAVLFLLEASEANGQRLLADFEEKSEAIIDSFMEKVIEIQVMKTEELRMVQTDLESGKITDGEAYQRRRDIDQKNADATEGLNQELQDAQIQMEEEREQLFTAVRDDADRIEEDIHIVFTAHGWQIPPGAGLRLALPG